MADEVLSRPPSHPIASTLLILSCIGTIGCIAFVWGELFTEYMPSKGVNKEIQEVLGPKHGAISVANGRKGEADVDHYRLDYGAGDMIEAIDQRLLDKNAAVEEDSPPAETPPPAEEGGGE